MHGHQNAVAQQAELVALKQQLADAMTRIDQGSSKDAEQIGARQEPAAVAGGAGRLADQGADLDDKRPNDWMLAESEYLVRMAGPQAVARTRHRSAITLLGNAERIKALNDPSLMPIRKALAEDIAKLGGDATGRSRGLTLEAGRPSDQIELLPSTVSMPEAKSEPDQTVSTNPDEWQSNLKKKQVHRKITIRRRDGAVELPRSRRSSRENLKTKLLQAQLAVYREQQSSMSTAWRRPSAG